MHEDADPNQLNRRNNEGLSEVEEDAHQDNEEEDALIPPGKKAKNIT